MARSRASAVRRKLPFVDLAFITVLSRGRNLGDAVRRALRYIRSVNRIAYLEEPQQLLGVRYFCVDELVRKQLLGPIRTMAEGRR